MSRLTTPAAHDRSGAALQRQAALRWAREAVRAYERGDVLNGECHRSEALEHAALVADHGRAVARVQRQIDAARERAWRARR